VPAIYPKSPKDRHIFTGFCLVLLNRAMREYTAKDIMDFYAQYERHITHVCVAQSRFRVFEKNPEQITKMIGQVSKDVRHCLNVFSASIYKGQTNKARRNPLKFKPLSFVTIEGASQTLDREQTIHVNIALGNLPYSLSAIELEIYFRKAWVKKANQANDIFFDKASEYPSNVLSFVGYSLKEAQQNRHKAWSENSIWDVTNCWIPHAALSAD
jgi:hypothetical protein